MSIKSHYLFVLVSITVFLTGCRPKQPAVPDYSVISSPEAPIVAQDTPTSLLPTPTEVLVAPATPVPNSPSLFEMIPATVLPPPPALAAAAPIEVSTETITGTTQLTGTAEVTATIAITPTATATSLPVLTTPPDKPRQGGSWDMEDGFEVWINPYGDDCSGSKVATGWKAFTSRGQYGSSCFYLNDYAPNVFSGQFSQLITFDFVNSHAGLLRVINTQPGHSYQVTARIRHVHTLPPMQYHFGVDLTGGDDWQADTVTWTPWAEFQEDAWMTHKEIFTATGPETTIFIKGFHDTASQGGATYIDAVEVIDLG